MDDLLTTLQKLGEELVVEERFVLDLKEGRRVGGWANRAAAASAAVRGDRVVRQVKLSSDWADVPE